MRQPRAKARGFTLLEVVMSVAILGISLTMLLTTNAASLNNAARARDLTVATLLTRSKMIDIEQEIVDEGFTIGDETDSGDFGEEGHKEIKWESKLTEVELTLDAFTDMCEGFSDSDSGDSGEGGCESMLGGFGGALEGMMSELGNSVRFVELTVTWPVGRKYTEKMKVTALLTREDWKAQEANDLQRAVDMAKDLGLTP